MRTVCEETTGEQGIKCGYNEDKHYKSLRVPPLSEFFSECSNASDLLLWLDSGMLESSLVPSCHNYHRSGIL